MGEIKIDTTYADLMNLMVPPGMYPDDMLVMVADQVMDLIPIERARWMLDSIRRFDCTFGNGEWVKMNTAMCGSIQEAIADLPPAELMRMSLELMKMQGVEIRRRSWE